MNLLIILNIFEGDQGAQHSHWGVEREHLLWGVTSQSHPDAPVFVGSGNPLVMALRYAEQDNSGLNRAYMLLEALPSIPKRRMLATYFAVNDAGRRQGDCFERTCRRQA
jgi:hypothetical protein